MRRKSDHYASELRKAYPVFLAGRLLGPNPTVRRWIGEVQRRVHAELGSPTMFEQLKSLLAVGAALWTQLILRFHLFQHPRLIRTTYRMPEKRWDAFEIWEGLQRKIGSPTFSIRVELQHAKQQVWLRMDGVPSPSDAESLAQSIREALTRSKNRLILDFNRLEWSRTRDLAPLWRPLEAYRSRIRIVLPPLAAAHPQIPLLESLFQRYRA